MNVARRGRRLAGLVLAALCLAGCGGSSSSGAALFQSAAPGDAGADTIPLRTVVGGQYLVPVAIGNQTFNLLLDTGFMGVLVFGDLISPTNTAVKRTGQPVTLTFGSGRRSGGYAKAPVGIGQHFSAGMRLVVIDSPTSSQDPSLAPRQAQGILGLRFKPGTGGTTSQVIDPTLLALVPLVRSLELNLNAAGQPTLTIGGTPILGQAAGQYVFSAQTTTALGGNRVKESYADLEVPFAASTAAGTANTAGLRVLLDTGAVDGLVLDTTVAQQLGYDPGSQTWSSAAGGSVNVNLLGTPQPLGLSAIPTSSVLVTDLSGTTFDAVLGVARWSNYVVAFDFIDWTLGGPSGTFRFLPRTQVALAESQSAWPTTGYVTLPGLNSSVEDSSPGLSGDGSVLVFDSVRPTGPGLRNVFYYRRGTGLMNIGPLNAVGHNEAPSVSADGNLVAFTSDRAGGQGDWDIYLWNVAQQAFVDLSGVNTPYLERAPQLSGNGRYLTFRSERRGNGDTTSDLFVYDLQAQTLLDTPGLDLSYNHWTGKVSDDGTRLVYDTDSQPGDQGQDDIHLYDLVNKHDLSLSVDVNSSADDLFVTMSQDGKRVAFQTTRFGTVPNVVVFDLTQNGSDGKPGKLVATPGLNLKYFDAQAPGLSGDGTLLAFASDRPLGVGSEDLYQYQLPAVAARMKGARPRR